VFSKEDFFSFQRSKQVKGKKRTGFEEKTTFRMCVCNYEPEVESSCGKRVAKKSGENDLSCTYVDIRFASKLRLQEIISDMFAVCTYPMHMETSVPAIFCISEINRYQKILITPSKHLQKLWWFWKFERQGSKNKPPPHVHLYFELKMAISHWILKLRKNSKKSDLMRKLFQLGCFFLHFCSKVYTVQLSICLHFSLMVFELFLKTLYVFS